MPIGSPEISNSISISVGVLAALSGVALCNEVDSRTVASVDLAAGVEADSSEFTQRNTLVQKAGTLAVDRVLPEHASRSANTTTSTIKATSIVKAPPTTVADTATTYPVGCNIYKPLVEKYDWPVETAMLVMSEESGCNPNKVSNTDDHGLFQLHGIRIYDPEQNIAYAYHNKYVTSRRGAPRNFSAWYAVCTHGNNPQPKFAGVNCQ